METIIQHRKCFSPVTWMFYILVMMISELLTCKSFPWWDAPVSVLFNILLYGVLSWELCCAFSFFNRRWQIALHSLLHLCVITYTTVNVFLAIKFHRHIDAFILQFVKETNAREASEFVSTYIISLATAVFLLVIMASLLLEYYLLRKVRYCPVLPSRNRLLRYTVVSFAILMSCNIFFFISDANTNYARAAGFPIKRNSLWTLRQSLLQYDEFQNEYDECAGVLARYKEKIAPVKDDADFVLIIGESFNRHVSNLYGARYNTNPLLMKYIRSGRLIVFNDVIASSNSTTQNFKYFLSMTSASDTARWSSTPLLPAILKHAGYNIVFYSNQFVRNDNLGQWDASMGFFNDPAIEPYLFTHRNTKTYQYDMGLVNDYVTNRDKLEETGRNFCIFHLYGQHVLPQQRYPEGFGRFSADNVARQQFSKDENGMFASYLNATEYNDSVVCSIIRLFEDRNAIVLYLSDHGEEVYNFRHQMGRTDMLTDCQQALHCQLDVPFMFYLSPTYMEKHPGMYYRIASARNKSFMTDDLPHMVLDILSVNTRWLDRTKSVINSGYSTRHKRILQGGRVYDNGR